MINGIEVREDFVVNTDVVKRACLSIWLPLGFFLLLSGMYFLPSRNAYKTVVYAFFILPSLVLLLLNWRTITKEYFQGATLIWALALFYLALSALWSEGPELGKQIKYAAMTLVAGYGVYHLYAYERKKFDHISALAIVVAACIALFWIIDYYLLLDHSWTKRFGAGRVDYFDLYSDKKYATFYNPLLLSHTVAFLITLTLGLFFRSTITSMVLRWALLVAGAVLVVFLVLNQTRMAYIVALAVIGFNLIYFCRKWGLAVTVFLAIVCLVLVDQYSGLLLTRGFSYRPEIWLESFRMFTESLLFGHGIGTQIYVVVSEVGHTWYDTHNIYLAVLYYGGAVGFFLVIAFIYKLFKEGTCGADNPAWFFSWLIFVGLIGMTDGGGLLARPNEHWFSLAIPIMFLLAYSRRQSVKRDVCE